MPSTPDRSILNNRKKQYNEELYSLGNRGIIIIAMRNQHGLDNEFYISGNGIDKTLVSMGNNPGYSFRVFSLPIGEYKLEDFRLYKYTSLYNGYRIEQLNLSNLIKPITIEVKNNDVIYIGEIDIFTQAIQENKTALQKFLSSNNSQRVRVMAGVRDDLKTIEENVKKQIGDKKIKVELIKLQENKNEK